MPAVAAAVELSPEQQKVLDMVKAGHSVFFTGAAGTGKSVLLRHIIQWCRDDGTEYAVTASTGIASINIGGQTLHSWAGIRLGNENAGILIGRLVGKQRYEIMKKVEELKAQGGDDAEMRIAELWAKGAVLDESKRRRTAGAKAAERWQKVEVLIIDESACVTQC